MEATRPSVGSSKQHPEILPFSSTQPPGFSSSIIPFRASIRFSTSSLSDLEITIPNVDEAPLPTVSALKQRIRFLRPTETHNRRLRLVLSGKLLGDQTLLKTIHAQH